MTCFLKGENKMTRLQTLDLPQFHRATIGFDRLFNDSKEALQIVQTETGIPHTTLHKLTKTSI